MVGTPNKSVPEMAMEGKYRVQGEEHWLAGLSPLPFRSDLCRSASMTCWLQILW